MKQLLRIVIFLMRITLYVLTLVLFLCTLSGLFFGTQRWWSEVTTHFIHLYFICGCVLLVCSASLKAKTAVWLNALVVASTAFLLIPYYLPPPSTSSDARAAKSSGELKLLHLNPQAGKNRNYSSTWSLIKAEQPDVIAVSEVESEWQRRLQNSLPDYPYKVISNVGGGIALLSKHPFSFTQTLYYGPMKRPRIVATLPIDGQNIQIIAVHPYIPVKQRMQWRNDEFKLWAPEVHADTTPTIVVGDFNSSPWSPYLRDFLSTTKLRDSALGFGVQPSWPADRAIVPPLTPIDNCFVSDHFVVTKRALGPNIGSDHLPILVTTQLRGK